MAKRPRHRMRARRIANARMSFRDRVASMLVGQLSHTINGWAVFSGFKMPAPVDGAPTMIWGQP